MTYKQYIKKLLFDLGSTTKDVARTLYRARIRGARHECASCPIANYIRAHAWGNAVTVGHDFIIIRRKHKRVVEMPTPDVLSEFMVAFDNYEYQELRKV